MAKKVKFLRPVGYGAVRFATGTIADLPEVWADRFIKNGSAVEVAPKAKNPAEDSKPKGKKKK
jgi:hypothetical protein